MDKTFNITYIGALIPSKGFHYLAKAWPKILKKIPTAHLFVVGSAALYGRKTKLGKHSLAQEPYETLILNMLKREDIDLKSVTFCVVLNEYDKRRIIQKTQVGIMNPSGRTETFGLSSTDFQQQNVPVVIRMKNGLLGTFEPNITGLGFYTPIFLHKKIIKLFNNPDLRNKLSKMVKILLNNDSLWMNP